MIHIDLMFLFCRVCIDNDTFQDCTLIKVILSAAKFLNIISNILHHTDMYSHDHKFMGVARGIEFECNLSVFKVLSLVRLH